MTEIDRYRRLKSLYLGALDLPPEAWTGFLQEACGEDASLRGEVEELLALAAEGDPDTAPGPDARPGERPRERGFPRRLRRVGPYEIEELLGRGGMGEVYRARDPRLDRQVAVKLLSPAGGRSRPGAEADERFAREARAASALDHPNVCTVHDFGVWEGRSYLVMAYYPGRTLEERLADGPLPVEEAVDVILQVARGLAAAHAAGVVHRDVKPSNVLLVENGPVKVLDFGLATRPGSGRLTWAGVPVGTPGHMAPEQLLRAETGPATDVWGLGALLYEMLAGQGAFEGDSLPAIFYATLHEEPPPLRETRPDVPEWLAAVVERCLRKDSGERFADAGEVARALASETAPAPRSKAAPDRRSVRDPSASFLGRPRAAWGAALALLVAAGLAAGLRWRGPDAPAATAVASLAVLPFERPADRGDLELLGDGLSERIATNLSRLEGLTVVASSSTRQLAGRDLPLAEIADRLGVEALVSGRLAEHGERLVVSVELVEGRTGRQLWGDRVSERPGDLTVLEADLSRRLAGAIGARLAGGARIPDAGTIDPVAYRAYLEGLHHATAGRWREAVVAYERALERDPSFALPWAAAARAYAYLAVTGRMPAGEAFPAAREAAERALAIDPASAEAWVALGQVRFFLDGDLEGALEAGERAVELDPGNALARYHLGAQLVNADRTEAAIRELERSLELDPLAPAPRMFMAFAHLRRHELERALAVSRRNLELHPGTPTTRGTLWRALWHLGRTEEALAAAGAENPTADLLADLAAGRRRQAEERVRELERHWSAAETPAEAAEIAFRLVLEWALLEDERALVWIRECLDGPTGRFDVFQILRIPEIDYLRGDSGFRRILREVGAPASFGDTPSAPSGSVHRGPELNGPAMHPATSNL